MEDTKRYLCGDALLRADPDTLDTDEMIRLRRVQQIPPAVRELCEERSVELACEILRLEEQHRQIMDFLNGEVSLDG